MADVDEWQNRIVGRGALMQQPTAHPRSSIAFVPPMTAVDAAAWMPAPARPMFQRAPHPRGGALRPPLAIADAIVPGVGGAGAATFAMLVDDGATVTYSWVTDVLKMLSGLERRASVLGRPRERYEFSSLLTDAQHRALLSTLAGSAAAAPLFLLGQAHEALVVRSSTISTLTVDSLALCDWPVAGQRIVVVSPDDGTLGEAVVQWTAGATIGVDVDLTAVALDSALAMPAIGVYLDAEQTIRRHAVNAGRVELVARAARPGYGNSEAVGTGATLDIFEGLPVWDRGNALEDAAQPLYTGAELVDLGGQIDMLEAFTLPDWGRALRLESERLDDWQWFKLFLDTIQGRRGAFLLPTGRPDLVPVGDASSGTLTVVGPPVADAPDYASDWFPSLAHRRLRIVLTDGTAVYRSVTACVENAGTQDLALSAAVVGAIERVELLETVRLTSDDVTVTWTGFLFEVQLQARVVQQ